jgi:hypothetical protein
MKFFLSILFFSVFQLASQQYFIGTRLDYNRTWVETQNEYTTSYNGTRKILPTLLFNIKWENNFFFETGLSYNSKSYTTFSKSEKMNLNYLSIPLKVGMSIGKKWNGFLNAGIVPSILLSNTNYPIKYVDKLVTYYSEPTYPLFNFAFVGEVGAGRYFKEKHYFYLSYKRQPSIRLANTKGFGFDSSHYTGTIWHNSSSFNLGYKYEL